MKKLISFILSLILVCSCFALPGAVEKTSAADSAKKGMDLSRYDGDVDFSLMKKRGVDFVILRCYSYWTKDARFDEYYEGAAANGIAIGSYNYMYATTKAEAEKEAKETIAALDGRKLEYPHFLDVEDKSLKKLSKKELTDLCLIELKIFEQAGYNVGMYCSQYFLRDNLDASRLTSYDKWIAKWTYYYKKGASNTPIQYSKQPAFSSYKPDNCALWQFSDIGDGNYYGVELKRIDMDYSYVDYAAEPGYRVSYDPEDYTVPSSTLKKGVSGRESEVKWAQAVMFMLGFRVAVNGSYGAYMKQAVEQLQSANGLEVNGKIDKPTRLVLKDIYFRLTRSFKINLKDTLSDEIAPQGYVPFRSDYSAPKCPFSVEGLKFAGWNVKRSSDGKWFCADGFWKSAKESKGSRLLVPKGMTLTLDENFSSFETGSETLAFYAVWKAAKADAGCAHENLKLLAGVEPTCTSKGKSGDIVCADCGKTVVPGAELAKLAHPYGEYVVKTPAKLNKDGVKVKTCTACGKQVEAPILMIKSIKLDKKAFTYDGTAHKPGVVALNSDGKRLGRDNYTLSYSGGTALGTHSVKVSFNGKYSGEKTLKYTVKLGKVRGLKLAKATQTSLKIIWPSLAGAAYYRVEISEDGADWSRLKTVSGTSATAKNLKQATKYYFRVTPFDSSKKFKGTTSGVFARGTITAAPSIKLKNSSSSVTVSYSSVKGASSYAIYKSFDGTSWSREASTTQLAYTINGLSKGRQIFVKVCSLNSSKQKSPYSEVKSVVVGMTTPPVGPVKNGTVLYQDGRYFIVDKSTGVKFALVNKSYTVPSSHAPGGLTSTCASAFSKLCDSAKNSGISIYSISGYRSYSTQNRIYNNYVSSYGKSYADLISARPGHSEHQLGLAIDCNSLKSSFAETAAGRWLAANCTEFGFIIRYQKGKTPSTGYNYEPWHIRYVGSAALAKKLTASGLSVEEYYGIPSNY